MIEQDRARLTNLLISTWPAGVRGYVWNDTLGDLDQYHATEAYRTLRETEERPPSVARFMAVYHARQQAQDPEYLPDHCELCDGTGARESRRAHNDRVCHPTPEQPCQCHAVEPCSCSEGKRMAKVMRAVLEHNIRARPQEARPSWPAVPGEPVQAPLPYAEGGA